MPDNPNPRIATQNANIDFGDGHPILATRTIPGARTHDELLALQNSLHGQNVDSKILTSSRGGEYLAVHTDSAPYLSNALTHNAPVAAPPPQQRDNSVHQTAEVISTTTNDAPGAHYQPDVATDADGVSTARIHGAKYADRARSEDSLTVIKNYNGGTSINAHDSDAAMRSVVQQVRGNTAGMDGAATFAGVMTNDQGITYSNIGDSHIFIVGDKGAVQLNTPQEIQSGALTNKIGGTGGG